MSDLDPRKRAILTAVVWEHVSTAEPVASDQLVRRYSLGVKSATVRNELAELSDLGLLEKPHTSAGRVPSQQGYRFYVDRLVRAETPDEAVQRRISEDAAEGDALQALLRDTVRTLSRATGLLGVATIASDPSLSLRTVVLSALGPRQFLLVAVLSDGRVENRMLEGPAGLTLDDVGVANERLRRSLVGRPLREVVRLAVPTNEADPVDRLFALVFRHTQALVGSWSRGTLVTDGSALLFEQPEFSGGREDAPRVIRDLLESGALYDAAAEGTTTVTIGHEHAHASLHRFSVVRSTFYSGGRSAGTVGVIGPIRMRYSASMPLVEITARTLTDSLARFFG